MAQARITGRRGPQIAVPVRERCAGSAYGDVARSPGPSS
jgi:hypothetical protein